MKEMDLNWNFTFGRFKGQSIQNIMDNNPWYLNFLPKIKWLVEKINNEMTQEDIKKIEAARYNYNMKSEIYHQESQEYSHWNDKEIDQSTFCGSMGFFD